MGAYKYMKETYQKELKERGDLIKNRIFKWRREPVVKRVEKPTNLVRARTLGYKAKDGYVVARVRIGKGKRRRQTPSGGRKPAHAYLLVQPGTSLRGQAEQKANRKYSNLEVLNSYVVGEDGNYKFFEVILVDKERTGTKLNKRRAYRGITSSGKKSRGYRAKGKRKPRRRSKKKERAKSLEKKGRPGTVKPKEKKEAPKKRARKKAAPKKRAPPKAKE
ncbi:50S ribosomal protein L15e [Candidatus Micrarchaeota archaeon]|nr:50S ribosomal protein L15e [Candidatus Micrarchaeota archaeon]MBD3418161.1 50S ribosomal protein L15e [Candidatus Micrarchaeota archaeon]